MREAVVSLISPAEAQNCEGRGTAGVATLPGEIYPHQMNVNYCTATIVLSLSLFPLLIASQ
jgi:hypothetical protein